MGYPGGRGLDLGPFFGLRIYTMPATVSTEGRVFVAQLTRDLAAREAKAASALSVGAKRWTEAFKAFTVTVSKSRNPRDAAQQIRAAFERLKAAGDGNCFVNGIRIRSRSAIFELFTYEPAPHPIVKTGYQGVAVRSYVYMLRRNGSNGFGRSTVAFLSWHALARMHERSKFDIFIGGGMVAMCGTVGYLARESEKHFGTAINVAVGDIICTGVLREETTDDGKQHRFFDVLTTLQLDMVSPATRAQGSMLGHLAHDYVKRDDGNPTGLFDRIPVLPFNQNDYVTRSIPRTGA
jgi:hypothetical protein